MQILKPESAAVRRWTSLTARTSCAVVVVAVFGANFTHAQLDERHYVKLESREATRAAALQRILPDLAWGDWWICGSFDNSPPRSFDIVFPPELGVDHDVTYEGKGNSIAQWKKIDTDGYEKINLKQFGDESLNNNSLAYLACEVESDRDAMIEFNVGSDDSLRLWFNGEVVIDTDAYRPLNINDHLVALPFRAGTNTLLAKVTQGGGGWEFQMKPAVDSRIETMLEYRLNIDFPRSREDAHYRLVPILEPRDVVLEVGGIDILPDGRPIVSTRRGEVWIIDGAYDEPAFSPSFHLFATGLHEPLGALWYEGALYVAQRGELTRVSDSDGDWVADKYETVSDRWGISGNYHEYAFGPEFGGDGRMWINLNLGAESMMVHLAPWRGWSVAVNFDGSLTPICGGLRSPNGIGRNVKGDMFFTDNQGDWIGTCKLSHLKPGSWHGHPASAVDFPKAGLPIPEGVDDWMRPAVWFPYGRMGQSASDIVVNERGGAFGPFAGQLFIGDQMTAEVMRVSLETVSGEYQGAAIPFRHGFDCGVNRLRFAPDGSLLAGMTNRGWGSLGTRPYGLQRVVFTGEMPFEMQTIHAQSDGFEVVFTEPVEARSASNLSSYSVKSFTYHFWGTYGSPEIETRGHVISGVDVSEDGLRVGLKVDDLRATYVHEIHAEGVVNRDGETLVHPIAWYTLNAIPGD